MLGRALGNADAELQRVRDIELQKNDTLTARKWPNRFHALAGGGFIEGSYAKGIHHIKSARHDLHGHLGSHMSSQGRGSRYVFLKAFFYGPYMSEVLPARPQIYVFLPEKHIIFLWANYGGANTKSFSFKLPGQITLFNTRQISHIADFSRIWLRDY